MRKQIESTMNSSSQDNTIAIIGLVLGIIAVLFSFIPCIGLLAVIPGVIGLVLGVISLLQARDSGGTTGMPISVIVISSIACLVVLGQILFFRSATSSAKDDIVKYTDCTELEAGYEILKVDFVELTEKMEKADNLSILSTMNKFIKLQARIMSMAEQSKEMDCGLDFDEIEREVKESQERSMNKGEDTPKVIDEEGQ